MRSGENQAVQTIPIRTVYRLTARIGQTHSSTRPDKRTRQQRRTAVSGCGHSPIHFRARHTCHRRPLRIGKQRIQSGDDQGSIRRTRIASTTSWIHGGNNRRRNPSVARHKRQTFHRHCPGCDTMRILRNGQRRHGRSHQAVCQYNSRRNRWVCTSILQLFRQEIGRIHRVTIEIRSQPHTVGVLDSRSRLRGLQQRCLCQQI